MSRNSFYLALIPLLLVLMAGCGESKISQCDRLIQPIKQTILEAKSTVKKPQNIDINSIKQGLSITDKAAANASAVQLQDPKLKEYQSALVNLYRTNSQGTQAFVDAFARKDRVKAIQALDKWRGNSFSDREGKLIAQIDSYCFGKE